MAAEVTPDQQQIVSVVLSSGRYPTEEAVLNEALELLHQRDRLRGYPTKEAVLGEALELLNHRERIRDLLQEGIMQLDAGERIPSADAVKLLRAGVPKEN